MNEWKTPAVNLNTLFFFKKICALNFNVLSLIKLK